MNNLLLFGVLIVFLAPLLPSVHALDKRSEAILNQPGMENLRDQMLGSDENQSLAKTQGIDCNVIEAQGLNCKAVNRMSDAPDGAAEAIFNQCEVYYAQEIKSQYSFCNDMLQAYHIICENVNTVHSYCSHSIWSNPKVTVLFN